MATLQSLKPVGVTFGSLATQVLTSLFGRVRNSGRIDFVCDQYLPDSINIIERERRAQPSSLVVRVTGPEQKLPCWKSFMSVSENKISLIDFLVSFWKTPTLAHLFRQRSLYVTARNECQRLTSPDGVSVVSETVSDLYFCQEEADMRMFLHASHAANNGASSVVVKSLDTDVAVIGLWVASKLPCNLLLQTGAGQHTRCFSLSQLSQSLGAEICEALPGFHAFTGCDLVSSFGRRGKKVAFKLLASGLGQATQLLGQDLEVPNSLLELCERFVCKLYGKVVATSVSDVRYSLFCQASRTSYEDLPPTQDALFQHVLRSNFQAHLWKACLQPDAVPHPDGHGWCMDGEKLAIVWRTQAPASSALMQHILVRCGYTGGCKSARCKCYRENVQCTFVCSCSASCTNKPESALDMVLQPPEPDSGNDSG